MRCFKCCLAKIFNSLFLENGMKVVLLRHGESEANVRDLINGDPKNKDTFPLTAKGKRQAQRAGVKLKEYPFDAIYATEFIRTQQTAHYVNTHHSLPIIIDKGLNEPNFGYEGKTAAAFNKIAFKTDFFNFRGNGKESWNDLKKRIARFIKKLQKKNYDCVLIVTHQWVAEAFYQLCTGISNEEAHGMHIKNCVILEVEI